MLSTKQFEEACVTVQSCEDDGRKTTYEKSIPSKAVHLVRDPFSNLVGRMHLHVKLQLSRGEITSLEDTPFTDTVQGFKAWCKYLDDTYAEVEADSTVSVLFRRYADLPCHAEW